MDRGGFHGYRKLPNTSSEINMRLAEINHSTTNKFLTTTDDISECTVREQDSKLGFDDYIEPLTIYLHRYRELEGERGSMRGEPLMKTRNSNHNNTVDQYGTMAVVGAAYAPAFHVSHHPHPHHHGFFGGAPIGAGYMTMRDANSNASSSHSAALANVEAFAQHQ
ncbi:hypothetical protein D5086_028627 [Populus alba]|uniref:Uncharacterized protein n=1 Tax=Populus alba TaxID=43335 RepID=A0ACC4AR57_POPAL